MLHEFWSFSRPVIGRRLLVVTLRIYISGEFQSGQPKVVEGIDLCKCIFKVLKNWCELYLLFIVIVIVWHEFRFNSYEILVLEVQSCLAER
jgi:hypothetical protein